MNYLLRTTKTNLKEFGQELLGEPILLVFWISWILSSFFNFVISESWIANGQWFLFYGLAITIFSTVMINKLVYFDKAIPNRFTTKVFLMRLWAGLVTGLVISSSLCSLIVLTIDGLHIIPHVFIEPAHSFWTFVGKIFYDIIIPIFSFIEFKLIKKNIKKYNSMSKTPFPLFLWK